MSEVPQYHCVFRLDADDHYLFEAWLPSIPHLGDFWRKEGEASSIVRREWNDDLTTCTLFLE